MRKIGSNLPQVINALPANLRENEEAFEFSHEDHSIKTLGIEWQPMSDQFAFKVCHLDSKPISSKDVKRAERARSKWEISPISEKPDFLTRRKILSDIATIFDPLGFLSCSVITLKICMQEIWKTKLGWDDPLPTEITDPYLECRDSLVL